MYNKSFPKKIGGPILFILYRGDAVLLLFVVGFLAVNSNEWLTIKNTDILNILYDIGVKSHFRNIHILYMVISRPCIVDI